jgi:hypothetical protein
MHSICWVKRIWIASALMLVTLIAQAQTITDKQEIYKLILQDYLDSASIMDLEPICLLDSTCAADYHNMGNDSIYEKYFRIGKYDVLGKINLRAIIEDSSKRHEKLQDDLFISNRVMQIKTGAFSRIFKKCHEHTNKMQSCWDVFYKRYKTMGYCRFSKPYFYDSKTALVYFYYLYGPLAGMGHMYLVVKEDNLWKIKARIWQWVS